MLYWDRPIWGSFVIPDQMPQNAELDHGLNYLPLTHQFLDTSTGTVQPVLSKHPRDNTDVLA